MEDSVSENYKKTLVLTGGMLVKLFLKNKRRRQKYIWRDKMSAVLREQYPKYIGILSSKVVL